MTVNIRPTPSPRRRDPLPHRASWSRPVTAASADLEFGRFRVLLRRRQLLADGVAVELGGRALDVLLVLLEADGARSSRKKSYSAGCGRAWWCRKKTSNLRFTHCVKRSAQTAIRFLRNLAAAIGSPACCA